MSQFRLKSRDYLVSPDRKRRFNKRLFTAIADEYGWMKRVLSFGLDDRWKREMVRQLQDVTAPACLDLACGNGDLVLLLLKRYPAARIVGLDLAEPMLEHARRRIPAGSDVSFIRGDMTATPLPDACFDLVTVGYGLRNAPELTAALQEIARVTKPGGLVAVLEFSHWDHSSGAAVERLLLRLWCGFWGWMRTRNPDTYAYIADSLAGFPTRSGLRRKFACNELHIIYSRRHFAGFTETLIAEKGPDG